MGLGQILFIVILLIFLTIFIVFVVKTFRQWGILHTILLSILFIQSWVFLYFTAGVQYERVRWTKDAAKHRKDFEDAEKRGQQLRFGLGVSNDDSLDAVVPAQGMLDRQTVDRGRVWRRMKLTDHQDNRVQLTALAPSVGGEADVQEDGAPPASTPARSESLPEDLVVYCFEEQLSEEGFPLPVFYLGEFRVVASNPATGQISVQPTLPLLANQIEQIPNAAHWALYETLPVDSHIAFTVEGAVPTDEAIFGQPDEELLKRIFGHLPQETLDAYLRDGQRADDNDRSESIWEQLKLLSAYDIDVDSDQSADASISGYFDQVGRSVDVRLKRAESVHLNPDELHDNRIVVIESVARDLISRGVAERLQRIYVRPLNDYLGLFSRHNTQRFELAERVKYYQYQNQLIDEANLSGQEMLAVRQQENQRLEADLQNYLKEIQFLNTATVEADAELQSLKQKLSKLYQAIQARRQNLVVVGS